ncbi:MAG TPA: prolyl oligopeptidase family serine peptidase [Chloroflexota bacterium]|nr:prolyl oligopeptidase family serine peptidase [Chloroflexota bacterium]
MPPFRYFPDHPHWSHLVNRLISEAHVGGGHFGEIHLACSRMRAGDTASWVAEWTRLAEQVEARAERAAAADHQATARANYFRAAQYYRWAEGLLDPDDPRKLPLYERAIACFRQGAGRADPSVEPVAIPYASTTLPGYFVRARGAPSGRAPAVVFVGGADSAAEELYFTALGIPERGMHLLVFDGPGQGAVLRFQRLPMRTDFEAVGTAVYDYLAERLDVDPARIGLMGKSLGGYLAPRIAAFEPRYAALVIWGALYDYHEVWAGRRDDHPMAANARWLMGAATMAEARERMRAMTLRGILDRIQCPTLIVHGAADTFMGVDHAERTLAELRCEKMLKVFTEEEGGVLHCQSDNHMIANEYIGDWLRDHLVTAAQAPAGASVAGASPSGRK